MKKQLSTGLLILILFLVYSFFGLTEYFVIALNVLFHFLVPSSFYALNILKIFKILTLTLEFNIIFAACQSKYLLSISDRKSHN